MTKIMRGPDQAAVTAEVLDLDLRRPLDLDPVAPLDDDRALVGELLQAEVAKLGAGLDAVQIDVCELNPAGIYAYELEGRAGDLHP